MCPLLAHSLPNKWTIYTKICGNTKGFVKENSSRSCHDVWFLLGVLFLVWNDFPLLQKSPHLVPCVFTSADVQEQHLPWFVRAPSRGFGHQSLCLCCLFKEMCPEGFKHCSTRIDYYHLIQSVFHCFKYQAVTLPWKLLDSLIWLYWLLRTSMDQVWQGFTTTYRWFKSLLSIFPFPTPTLSSYT